MAYDIGPRIGIDGEPEFRRAIQNINTNIRTLGTEMLAVTSAYDANDKSAAALTARNEVLAKQIDAQKEKLAKLQEGLEAARNKYGETDETTLRWQQTVNMATAELNKMERQLASNNQEIDNQKRALDSMIDGEDDLRQSIEKINTTVKTLGTEMLAVTSAYDANDKSIESLTSRNEVLNKQIDAQKEKLSKLQEGLAASTEKFGESGEKTQQWQQAVNTATAELNKLERQLASNTQVIENQKQASDSMIDGEDNLRQSIEKINTTVKTLGTEMLAVTSAYDANDRSVEALTEQNIVLNKQIDVQKEKLARLQEGLDKSAVKFGENDEKTQEWQQEVNRATAELNQMERQLAENTRELAGNTGGVQENTGELKKQGSALDGISGKLKAVGSGFAAAAKAAATGVAAAGTAVGALVKSSVEGYAACEQLVGGVETLFQSSSGKVVQYANNAYKTAGLSANEYMETVTGFSASLLQSLNGDTAKAADIADKAITDMSDNANKMGSDMESIQNAYSGFAKQNYTMLDNLKLGYGGTKEEMQRLLSDAEKLSGQKFDLSSYSDIIEAIHVVQTEMGITGTTAKEASTTIQGSVGAVKSAWENLAAGLAGDSQDLDQLIGSLIDSVATAGENVLPRVEAALSGIGQMIEAAAPIVAEEVPKLAASILPSMLDAGVQLLGGIVEGLVSAAPALAGPGAEIVGTLAENITAQLPGLTAAALAIIATLSAGIADSLPELVPSVVDTVLQIVETLTDPANLDSITGAALEIITALAAGLISALPALAERVPQIIANIVATLTGNLPKIITMAGTIIAALANGLIQSIPVLVKSVPQIVTAIVKGFTSMGSQFKDIGKNIVNGVWQGIQGMASWIRQKVSGFFSGIVSGVKNVLGIHSPSKVFAGIGGYMAEGLGQGFGDEMGAVQRSIRRSMAELAGNASGTVRLEAVPASGGFGGFIGTDVDFVSILVSAIQQALAGMGIYLDGRRVGQLLETLLSNDNKSWGR